jgi:lysophospholipase L1-like esterase
MKNKTHIGFLVSLAINLLLSACLIMPFAYQYFKNEKIKSVILPPPRYFLERDQLFKILPKESDEIVFIGDSHIQYFELFEFFKNTKIKNRGISGDHTAALLARLDESLKSHPDKMFIEIGTNDLYFEIPHVSIIKNYRSILERIKAQSPLTKVYVISVIPCQTMSAIGSRLTVLDTQRLNASLRALAKEYEVKYIDLANYLYQEDQLNKTYYCNDALHLNALGYGLWTKVMEKDVK